MPDHEVIPAHPGSAIAHVGAYRRVLPVSLERLYENALDWEHLPFVHADSFRSIEVMDAGAWGWRADVVGVSGESMVLELALDRRCRRWITRTLAGPNSGAEIWTHAFPVEASRVDIVVDFFVPGVKSDRVAKVGRAFADLYTRLYDQDVGMMVERQRQLDRRLKPSDSSVTERELGPRADLRLPLEVQLGGRQYVVAQSGVRLVAYPSFCPHQFGPLAAASLEEGIVTCPWHGYRFDVSSGECVSGQSCRLNRLPVVDEKSGSVVVRLPH